MLAKNMRFLRRQNRLSRQAVADRIGLKSQATILHWECGHTEPTFLYFARMAELFDVNMNQFYEDDLEELYFAGLPYRRQQQTDLQVQEVPSVFSVPKETEAALKANVIRQVQRLGARQLVELAAWLEDQDAAE